MDLTLVVCKYWERPSTPFCKPEHGGAGDGLPGVVHGGSFRSDAGFSLGRRSRDRDDKLMFGTTVCVMGGGGCN